MFGARDKGICSIFPRLTVGVLGDGGRGEKVGLRFIGEEVCKEVEGRNNEREGGRQIGEGEAEECVKRPRQTCQGTN